MLAVVDIPEALETPLQVDMGVDYIFPSGELLGNMVSAEIAMLQSVGMTGHQVRKMLMYEGIGYSALGLLSSLMLSIVGSLTVVRMMGAELSYFTWHFTLLPVILCMIPLVLITAFVPLVCYNRMAQKTVAHC